MVSSEPRWHPEAVQEAEEARDWYAVRSPLAARGFVLTLDKSIQAILEAPTRWPAYRYGCRRYVFPNRYPFAVYYRVGECLEILAVAHQRRRPDYWKDRG